MYQVVINDKYYVSSILSDCFTVFSFEATTDKYEAKFFEYKKMAENVANQIGGKVIEYTEKKDVEIEVECDIDADDILKQLGVIK